ncbi:MAG: cysteine--tRNA ligase [Sphingomonadaceae bacterium]
MLLYDTMTLRKEPFVPSSEPVTLYVCGITPYDTTHLGHAFTYVFYDVLVRYLRYLGHGTRYVQNVTDVDDDILRKARELSIPWDRLAVRGIQHYQEDMAALNVLPPDVFPKASEEISKMIEMAKVLLKKGYAYRSGGSVYFHVRRDPSYGQLSHLSRAEMLPIANERGNDPNDPLKRDPLDFVLWQHSAPDEPRWDSPWGMGRPGWHLECSAMATHYLGDTIDIHGGGYDLVFPHHESEIVQSENYSGKHPFARYWVHTAMVYLNGKKMSKSLGNLVMVRELLDSYSSDAVRLLLLGHHHTEPWEYDQAEMEQAARDAALLVEAARGERAALPLRVDQLEEGAAFLDAMDDDMDTPRAIRVLKELAQRIVRRQGRGPSAAPARTLLREVGRILGLRLV